jgi:thioredoxin reductase (NADPH)
MSRYLIDRIGMLRNVDVIAKSEIVELHGERAGTLEGLTIRNRASDHLIELEARQLFMFIGAEPNTGWLEGCVGLDARGYVVAGVGAEPASAALVSMQTSMNRVFAIGDVRSGSTKRVASAVGEGAAVVAQIHSFLKADSSPT